MCELVQYLVWILKSQTWGEKPRGRDGADLVRLECWGGGAGSGGSFWRDGWGLPGQAGMLVGGLHRGHSTVLIFISYNTQFTEKGSF